MKDELIVTAKEKLEKISEISDLLKVISIYPKISIISRENIAEIEGNLWLSIEEYEKIKKQYRKKIQILETQKQVQIKLLKQAHKNEKERINYEYSVLMGLFRKKRTSRKKLSERKIILDNELQEMIEIIEKEFIIKKREKKGEISLCKKKLRDYVTNATNALLEFQYLKSCFNQQKQTTPHIHTCQKGFLDDIPASTLHI